MTTIDEATSAMRAVAHQMILRGFSVFPCRVGGNGPIAGSRHALVTNDPARVDALWTRPYNVAIDTDASGLVVLDGDRHKPGVDGVASLLSLDLPPTLTVATPGNGIHAFFRGPLVQSSASAVLPGLDVRSHAGYVVAPGCPRFDCGGRAYRIIDDSPVADLPPSVRARMRPPLTRHATDEPDVETLDLPGAVEQGRAYLTGSAPEAIEGEGGNHATFAVACRLKDFGLARETAAGLMLDCWNDQRAVPPWTADEIAGIVANAYTYGRHRVGWDGVDAHFSGVSVPQEMAGEPPTSKPVEARDIIRFGELVGLDALPPRPWVLEPFLLRRQITQLVAAGATGKSTLAMDLAVSVATGADFLGRKVSARGKVIVFSGEDDRDEMCRRLYAYALSRNLDPVLCAQQVAFVPGSELRLKITKGATAEFNKRSIATLAARCRAEGVVLVIVDPITGTHESAENDNSAMARVAEAFESFATDSDCAVLLVHHTKKGYGKAVSAAGDADAGRGAGALTASFRINLTLVEATDDDLAEYGVPEGERSSYVRLDGAKMNLSKKDDAPIWFRREGVTLPNGDSVGTMMQVDIRAAGDAAKIELARQLWVEMDSADATSCTVYKAASYLQAADGLYAKRNHRTVENRVKAALKSGVSVPGLGTMRVIVEGEGKDARDMVVMHDRASVS